MARAASFCCAAWVRILMPGRMTAPMGTCTAGRWPRMVVERAAEAGCGAARWFMRIPSLDRLRHGRSAMAMCLHGIGTDFAIKGIAGRGTAHATEHLQPHGRKRSQQFFPVGAGDDAAVEDGHGPAVRMRADEAA